MQRALLFSIVALLFASGALHAQKPEPNKAIIETEKRLIGNWKLVAGLPDADAKGDRIWSFGQDHVLADSEEDKGMNYFLVQNAGGEIWMLMLYSLGDSGPMIMKVQIDGDTLKLNHVGETPDGTYGAVPDGGLTFKRQKEGEQGGSGQPATRPESKPEGSDKPQSEAEGRPR